MSYSEHERNRLHLLLDDIISSGEKLESERHKLESENGRQELAREGTEIFSKAAELFSALVSEFSSEVAFGAFPNTDDPDRFRWMALDRLHEKLTFLAPVLGAPNWQWWVDNFLDELALLRSGDEPTILKPAKRKPGQGKRPGRVAFLRCQALQWLEYMRAHGIKRKERHSLVREAYSEAYGLDSDTIRKWRGLCEKTLGKNNVSRRLAAAQQTGWAPENYLTVGEKGMPTLSEQGKAALQENGETYIEFFRIDRLGNT